VGLVEKYLPSKAQLEYFWEALARVSVLGFRGTIDDGVEKLEFKLPLSARSAPAV
jgi:hypothetical protein